MEPHHDDPRWERVRQAVEALLPRLELSTQEARRPADLELAEQLAACCEASKLPPGPAPPRLAVAFSRLAQRLADLAASLQQPWSGSWGVHQCAAASWACGGLASLLAAGAIELPEQDWERLLASADIPVARLPLRLRTSALALLGDSGTALAHDSSDVGQMLSAGGTALHALLRLAAVPPASAPPWFAARLQEQHLALATLQACVKNACDCGVLWMRTTGSCEPPPALMGFMHALLASGLQEAMKASLEQLPALQRSIVLFAGFSLRLPDEQLAEACSDASRCTVLQQAVQLAASRHVAAGRRQLEMGDTPVLLKAAGPLMAQPQLLERRGSPEQASLLISALQLMAVLGRDACRAVQATLAANRDRAGGQGVYPASEQAYMLLLLRQLGSGLPLLHMLASEVAAAAGPTGSSSRGPSDSGTGGGTGFGALCWGQLAEAWSGAVSDWAMFLTGLSDLDLWMTLSRYSTGAAGPPVDSSVMLAACRAAEAVLRLAPLLTHLPVREDDSSSAGRQPRHDGWQRAGQAIAAAGGVAALHPAALIPPASVALPRFGGTLQLAAVAPHVARTLLKVSSQAATCQTAECAEAAFHAHTTACRYAHAMSSALGSAELLAAPRMMQSVQFCLPTAMSLVLACQGPAQQQQTRSHTQISGGGMRATQDNEEPCSQEAQEDSQSARRLECCMVLHLTALRALHSVIAPARLAWAPMSCGLFLSIMQQKGQGQALLRPLWTQLLSSSTKAAAGMDVARILADVAAIEMEVGAALLPAPPDEDEEDADMRLFFASEPLRMLTEAVQLEPGVAAQLAQHEPLLRGLLTEGARHVNNVHISIRCPNMMNEMSANKALTSMGILLGALAPHLPEGCVQHSELRRCMDRTQRALERLKRHSMMWGHGDLYAPALTAASSSSSSSNAPSTSASGPDPTSTQHPGNQAAQELALRRVQALQLLRRCGNPRCANLRGAGEAGGKGRLCSGCRSVRFCSDACSKAEWRQHKLACRQLGAAAAAPE